MGVFSNILDMRGLRSIISQKRVFISIPLLKINETHLPDYFLRNDVKLKKKKKQK